MSLRLIYGGLVFALLALAVAVRIVDPTPVARFRLIVFDLYQQLWPRTYDPELPVRVVLIDEKSLKTYGQWPWPRSVIATLTRRLAESGTAVVAFDFVLAEPDRLLPSEIVKWVDPEAAKLLGEQLQKLPSGDEALGRAIAGVSTVLGFIGVGEGTSVAVPRAGFAFAGDDPAAYLPTFSGAVASLPALQKNGAGTGSLNWIPEYDQVVRRLPLVVRVGDQLYPSLAAEAIRVAQGASTIVIRSSGASGEETFGRKSGITAIRIGEFEVPTDANGQIWLRVTRTDPRRIINASDVFEGKVARGELEGRIVVLGTGAAGLSDIKTTALDASVAGAELHGQAIEQILLGSHLRRLEYAEGIELVLLVLSGLLLAFAVFRFGAMWSGVAGGAIIASALVGSLVAYRGSGLLFDPAYPITALTGLYLATTVLRYLQTEMERTRIRDTFGRYLSDDVVATLLSSPAGTRIGGEKSKITMMMTDLRGFTSLSERVAPEQVVGMLNDYLGAMTHVIEMYGGTIGEFIGDAIFILFGAPIGREDDAEQAVACAVAMQLAMSTVNEQNRRLGLPDLAMGIGIHTGQVVVGNIGSARRMKYGVIGSSVNLTSRIQSFTTGGQILISEATRDELGGIVRVGQKLDFKAKGVEKPVIVFEVLGVAGRHDIYLPTETEPLIKLGAAVPVEYAVVEGSSLAATSHRGSIVRLSSKEAEIELQAPVALMSNLQITQRDIFGAPRVAYCKVVELLPGGSPQVRVRFTSVPPDLQALIGVLLQTSAAVRTL